MTRMKVWHRCEDPDWLPEASARRRKRQAWVEAMKEFKKVRRKIERTAKRKVARASKREAKRRAEASLLEPHEL